MNSEVGTYDDFRLYKPISIRPNLMKILLLSLRRWLNDHSKFETHWSITFEVLERYSLENFNWQYLEKLKFRLQNASPPLLIDGFLHNLYSIVRGMMASKVGIFFFHSPLFFFMNIYIFEKSDLQKKLIIKKNNVDRKTKNANYFFRENFLSNGFWMTKIGQELREEMHFENPP